MGAGDDRQGCYSRWSWLLLAVLAVLAGALALAPSAQAASPPGLGAAGAPGLHVVRGAQASAVHELRSGLSGAALAGIRGPISGVVLAGPGIRLVEATAAVSSPGAARRLLGASRAAHPGSRRAGGGPGIALVWRVKGGVRVLAVDGLGVAVARFTGAGTGAGAQKAALLWARSLALQSSLRAPPTAWQRVLSQIRPDGYVSKSTALQAFALAYGSLPGVRRPHGPVGQIGDGTLAGKWALAFLGSMTPAQRAAVGARLGIRLAGATAARASAEPVIKPDPRLTQLADHFANVYAAKLGVSLTLAIDIGWVAKMKDSGDSWPVDATGALARNATWCQIRISRSASAGHRSAYVDNTVAHEVFHCFQFELAAETWDRPLDSWILEGGAEWAADTVAPVRQDESTSFPNVYFGLGKQLFEQSYSAAYFWGRIAETNGEPWGQLIAALNAPDNATAFAAATGLTDSFLNAWAPSLARLSGAGPAWATANPLVASPAQYSTPVQPVATDGPLAAGEYNNQLYDLIPPPGQQAAQVYVFSGRLRLTDGKNDIPVSNNEYLCIGGHCDCPSGQQLAVPLVDTGPIVTAALTGATDSGGGVGFVNYYPVKDLCAGQGPTYCPTAEPFNPPHSMQGAVTWLDDARSESRRLYDTLTPLGLQADRIGNAEQPLGPVTPNNVGEWNALRYELYGVQLAEWGPWCRFQELSLDASVRLLPLARRVGWIRGPSSPVIRAYYRWVPLAEEMLTRLPHHFAGMPGSNPAAVGPPTPLSG